MRNLQGKVAIVTGAANGIGKAIAERLVQEGCSVIWADADDSVEIAANYCPPGCLKGLPYVVSCCRAACRNIPSLHRQMACLVTNGTNHVTHALHVAHHALDADQKHSIAGGHVRGGPGGDHGTSGPGSLRASGHICEQCSTLHLCTCHRSH